MKVRLVAAAAVSVVALSIPAVVFAHFILAAPQSWINENQLGDPQKAGPCGGSATQTLTNAVTAVRGGDMIHIQTKETVYHPGFFRVALSVLNRSELPADPEATTKAGARGPLSVSGRIESAPQPPVLVDGIFNHHTRTPNQVFDTDVKLPNINCDKCSLQVIQFMEEHGENAEGRFTYHHCADLKITANPMLPIDKRWPGQG
ncbi:MAG: SCE4755 family polysaccharide monooxygenase-like protein [Alphaproteobacteria bacterium]